MKVLMTGRLRVPVTDWTKPMRMFTIYRQPVQGDAAPDYGIRAAYMEASHRRRYGTLQVCTGWPLERVLEKFRALNRHDAVKRLAEELAAGLAATIEMSRQELALWNSV